MNSWLDFLIIAVILMNLMMLSSSRIRICIRIVAVQGVLIAILPALAEFSEMSAESAVSLSFTLALKGFVFPLLLFRAQQTANIRKEVEPIGGYPLSLLMGIVLFLISCWLNSKLLFPKPLFSDLAIPVSFSTFFTGAFIIVSRTKAITQVIGYLMLENGIYLFGSIILGEQTLLVELAILLDIFVAVFVMGIAIFHISREFDHIDTHNLSELKDWLTSK